MRRRKTFTAAVCTAALAAALFAAGCSDDDNPVDPQNQPPPGATDETSAIRAFALSDGFSANDEATMDDGQMQPTEYGVTGKMAADITPLRFGRFITSVTKNVEVTYGPGDTTAEALVTKDILGVFRVRGINGLGCLCGPFAESRWAPGALWRRVSDLTAPLVYPLPRLAFALLCVKDLTRR